MRSSSSAPWRARWGAGAGGDFFRDRDGRLSRRGAAATAPYMFTGVQLLHPRLFVGAPAGAYSLNRHYDEAILAGRLFGLVHRGHMLHAGSPEGLAQAEGYLGGERAVERADERERRRRRTAHRLHGAAP